MHVIKIALKDVHQVAAADRPTPLTYNIIVQHIGKTVIITRIHSPEVTSPILIQV